MRGMFDSLPLAAWNAAAISVWAVAIIDIARMPRGHWHNPRGRVLLLLLVAGPSIFYRGAFIPLAPMIWLAGLRRAGVLGLRRWAERQPARP